MKTKPTFDNVVAETLLIPLYMRAQESNRRNPILRDPYAQSLVERIDFDFSVLDKAWRSQLGSVTRARYFDDKVERFIRENPTPVIVNVGCGLDTRFQRIPNSHQATCYDLDLPEVIALRQQFIPAQEGNHYISASLLDSDWLDMLRQRHPQAQFAFVFEGVLMYFYEAQVKDVLLRITDRFSQGDIYFDLGGPQMKSSNHDTLRSFSAEFRCSLADGHLVEQWIPRLQLIEQRCCANYFRRRWGLSGVFARFYWRYIAKFYSFFAYRITAP